jgi:hypothetical protein
MTGADSNFTQATSLTFNFSDKWRFYYNEADDAIEIQKNSGGTWSTTAILAS